MVVASELANEIIEAVDRGGPVVISPVRFEILQPEIPEQMFLRSEIVVSDASFDPDEFALNGRADLEGLGQRLAVCLHFGTTFDDEVSSIVIDVREAPGLTSHPFMDLLLQEMPTLINLSASNVSTQCYIEEQRNSSFIGLTAHLSDLGVGVNVHGVLSSLCTLRGNDLDFVNLSSKPMTQKSIDPKPPIPSEAESFLVDDVTQWAGIPSSVIPIPFRRWIATSLDLSWGPDLSSLSVILEGSKEIFGEPSDASLTFSRNDEQEATWSSGGQLQVSANNLEEKITFSFEDFTVENPDLGDERFMGLSSATEGDVTLAGFQDLQNLPFLSEFPDISTLIPSDLSSAVDSVAVDNASVIFNQSSERVSALGASVSANGQWQVIADLFSIEEIRVWFLIGLAEQERRMNAGLEATCRMSGGLTLNASAQFPEGRLELRVRDPLDLGAFEPGRELLPPFDGDLSPEDELITLRDLVAICDLSDHSYYLNLRLATGLSAPPWFSLTGVRINIAGEAGHTEATIQAQAVIKGATALVAIQRVDTEWIIHGDLHLPDETTFSQWIKREFERTLPAAVDTLRFGVIHLSYRTSGRELSFTCSGDIELGDAPSQFQLDVTHGAGETDAHGKLILFPHY
ncbi:hypothetical protein QZH56_00530 [Streptomyces olivoreticuli]|uniref:hypothetical protein n=1 Tax=Streptomyces olivoreticuli TaxID=68246 RepID=UPI002657C953|nr:hypothetical protein [Streptomyces olivoreticuli]WKK24214.1 hypothetical protein QZH56_00530 [Streptomyces olivoreticuli]